VRIGLGVTAFLQRILHGFPLADEIEHHHRMGEQHHERRKETE
jgi:hypothetical protein